MEPLYKNKDWLIARCTQPGATNVAIGIECGVSNTVIGYWRNKFGIPVGNRYETGNVTLRCIHCGVEKYVQHHDARSLRDPDNYSCPDCRHIRISVTCPDCGQVRQYQRSHAKLRTERPNSTGRCRTCRGRASVKRLADHNRKPNTHRTFACVGCGAYKTVSKGQMRDAIWDGTESYRCQPCYNLWNAEQANARLVSLTCAGCGAEKQYISTVAARMQRPYYCFSCSVQRRQGENNPKWRGGNVILVCADCGKETQHQPGEAVKRQKPFRCHTCTRRYLAGERNGNWKGGLSSERSSWAANMPAKNWQRTCRKRDAAQCQRCGIPQRELDEPLHAHHKAGFTQYPELRSEPANGICLCRDCHNWTHSTEGRSLREQWEREALAELGHLLEAEVA